MNFFVKTTSTFVFGILLAIACKQDPGRNTKNDSNVIVKSEIQNLKIELPEENGLFTIGNDVSVSYSFKDSTKQADSLVFKVNGKKASKQTKPYEPFRLETEKELPGAKNITLTAYYPDSTIESKHIKITLLSDIKPTYYEAKVVASYPHDKNAYTQGLLYENGVLYESTGQTGQSTLRKVNLETGESIKVLNLPPDMFGEGLASTGNYLYQLTYKNNIAFQYDKNTFELVNKFNFPMKEGWGLTYDGKNLLMTDGTEKIYFLDPDYFTEVKNISVYDDKGPVYNLNELEFIKNEIWANVFTTDTIVRIEPNTGKVTGKLVIRDVLREEDYHSKLEVLNGIAYDKEKDRLFITGKNWPKLFEIKLVKR